MQPTVAAFLAVGIVASPLAMAGDPMPAPQQNALVQKYCAVCHTDKSRNGGLSLEHFDAAHPDPGVAATMLGKLKSGAMGPRASRSRMMPPFRPGLARHRRKRPGPTGGT